MANLQHARHSGLFISLKALKGMPSLVDQKSPFLHLLIKTPNRKISKGNLKNTQSLPLIKRVIANTRSEFYMVKLTGFQKDILFSVRPGTQSSKENLEIESLWGDLADEVSGSRNELAAHVGNHLWSSPAWVLQHPWLSSGSGARPFPLSQAPATTLNPRKPPV